jgi:D-glycero-D-manno-heptose 1,7-bisphosphate phosphatase
MKDKAVFLDRDGTINREVNYLYRIEDFEFLPGAIEAIKTFHELGYRVIIVSNQAGVARGYYTENDIHILHNYINGLLEEKGTYIDAFYYCPHHPDGIVEKYNLRCNCRKPNIGMVKQALNDYNIDLEQSIFIGDKEIDIETGKNAGIGRCILVRSGHLINESDTEADIVYDNILDVVRALKKI